MIFVKMDEVSDKVKEGLRKILINNFDDDIYEKHYLKDGKAVLSVFDKLVKDESHEF